MGLARRPRFAGLGLSFSSSTGNELTFALTPVLDTLDREPPVARGLVVCRAQSTVFRPSGSCQRDGALDDAGPSGQPRALSAAPRRLTVWRGRRRCLGPLDRRLARLYAGCRARKPARPQAARVRPAAGLTSALAARVISRFGVGDRAQLTGATRRSQRPWRRTGYGQGSGGSGAIRKPLPRRRLADTGEPRGTPAEVGPRLQSHGADGPSPAGATGSTRTPWPLPAVSRREGIP